jgi:hypothetical protein
MAFTIGPFGATGEQSSPATGSYGFNDLLPMQQELLARQAQFRDAKQQALAGGRGMTFGERFSILDPKIQPPAPPPINPIQTPQPPSPPGSFQVGPGTGGGLPGGASPVPSMNAGGVLPSPFGGGSQAIGIPGAPPMQGGGGMPWQGSIPGSQTGQGNMSNVASQVLQNLFSGNPGMAQPIRRTMPFMQNRPMPRIQDRTLQMPSPYMTNQQGNEAAMQQQLGFSPTLINQLFGGNAAGTSPLFGPLGQPWQTGQGGGAPPAASPPSSGPNPATAPGAPPPPQGSPLWDEWYANNAGGSGGSVSGPGPAQNY